MKNHESVLDKIASCHDLIKMIERQENQLRKELSQKKQTYKGRYINLKGYQTFFEEHEQTKEATALDFDLNILTKALGKRNLKSLNA